MPLCLNQKSPLILSCLAAISMIVLSGCGKDASQTAKISLLIPGAHPPTSTPSSLPIASHGSMINGDSQGGVDGNLVHYSSSGSNIVSRVSAGGSIEKSQSVSANFKVTGGIYVQ